MIDPRQAFRVDFETHLVSHSADQADPRYRQRAGTLGALRRVEFIWSCRDTGSFGWFKRFWKSLSSRRLIVSDELAETLLIGSQFLEDLGELL